MICIINNRFYILNMCTIDHVITLGIKLNEIMFIMRMRAHSDRQLSVENFKLSSLFETSEL